ncbi:hypothetical protein ACFVWR_10810 [Leifsonia sp. NPDC058292]|uniref:hypothetical protein n=1 Tax=Leifsonia sp. NPDC058292 TaxID=3346428 RepID=UPI0036D9190A
MEFARLWSRGLAGPDKLWQLFDLSELYLQPPGYFGAPVFTVNRRLVTPIFSSQANLARFMVDTGQVDATDASDGYDWVRLTGRKLFGLPVRARYAAIDPSTEHGALVDLRARQSHPPLAHGAPPVAINLELLPDGSIGCEPPESGFAPWEN